MSGRGPLKAFFHCVQLVMLLVSIPNVAMYFGAYNPHGAGVTLLSVSGFTLTTSDVRNILVGIGIDLAAFVTSIAAVNAYAAHRRIVNLAPHAIIIGVCATLSVIANYEDAATILPPQYAHVVVFGLPAFSLNPPLISAPPLLALLLVFLVPSITAVPQVKSAAEIAEDTAREEARIAAEGRLKIARAERNAAIRAAQVRGAVATAQAGYDAARRRVNEDADARSSEGDDARLSEGSMPALAVVGGTFDPHTSDDPDDTGGGPGGARRPRRSGNGTLTGTLTGARAQPPQQWYQRARNSGVITVNDLRDALGIGATRATAMLKQSRLASRASDARNAPLQAPLDAFLAWLEQDTQSAENRWHARTLRAGLAQKSGGRNAGGKRRGPSADARSSGDEHSAVTHGTVVMLPTAMPTAMPTVERGLDGRRDPRTSEGETGDPIPASVRA